MNTSAYITKVGFFLNFYHQFPFEFIAEIHKSRVYH